MRTADEAEEDAWPSAESTKEDRAIEAPSPRPYAGLLELEHPFHDTAVTVTTCGRICFNCQKINLSQVFAGQTVGIKKVHDPLWLASFMRYDRILRSTDPHFRLNSSEQLPIWSETDASHDFAFSSSIA